MKKPLWYLVYLNFQAIFSIKDFKFEGVYSNIDAYNALLNDGPNLESKNYKGETALIKSMHLRIFLKNFLNKILMKLVNLDQLII